MWKAVTFCEMGSNAPKREYIAIKHKFKTFFQTVLF